MPTLDTTISGGLWKGHSSSRITGDDACERTGSIDLSFYVTMESLCTLRTR